ncbi:hypothetical protein CmeUKMEL1_18790 [Cryptosporidium meleagridis]|uniref:Uncharacterized protein n=1 Tax=Cryptosporidium meleagridis TaxID=93969 RepID=A0A2P4Z6M5_9CRYT|nr:hypothetical protein CmeUKMEL1_18790 [Cryptosporidium meleagridis]
MLLSQNNNRSRPFNTQSNNDSNLNIPAQKKLFNNTSLEANKETNKTYDNISAKNRINQSNNADKISERQTDLLQNQHIFKKYTTTTTAPTNFINNVSKSNGSDQLDKTPVGSNTMNQTTNLKNEGYTSSSLMLTNGTSQGKFALSPLNGTEVAPLFSKFVPNEDTSDSVKFGYSSPPSLSKDKNSSQSNE